MSGEVVPDAVLPANLTGLHCGCTVWGLQNAIPRMASSMSPGVLLEMGMHSSTENSWIIARGDDLLSVLPSIPGDFLCHCLENTDKQAQTQKPWKIKIWIKGRTGTALCSPYLVSWFQRTWAGWPAPLAHKASFLGNPHRCASWIWRPRDLFWGTLRKTPSLREAHSQAFL